jgi:DNA invertase Pin-like site-specific DNA recombinase
VRAAIFARTAASNQADIARQIADARAYAARNGWVIADEHVYADDGFGGADFVRRPGLRRLLGVLGPPPPFDVLLISEPSRLGRVFRHTQDTLDRLARAGVRVVFYDLGPSEDVGRTA